MEIFKKEKNIEFIVALFFVLIGVSLRLIPHTPNFTPIAAIALFGGVYLSKKLALIIPIGAMIISDYFIGYYEPKLMVFVYGSFILSVILGFWIKRNKKWYTVGGGAVLSAILFFIVTNFGVWLFAPWYANTLSGLIQCYVAALPFFRNTLSGDLFYAGVFFGSYELIYVFIKNRFKLKDGYLRSTIN